MSYNKHRMQDLTSSDARNNLLFQYIQYWSDGNFAAMETFLTNHPELEYKVFNAENFNRLINLINDGTRWSHTLNGNINTDTTVNSVAGKFAEDYNTNYNAYKNNNFEYVGEWDSSFNYKKNQAVTNGGYRLYICIQDNSNKTLSNTDYWLEIRPRIIISTSEPSNINDGDLWLEEIS